MAGSSSSRRRRSRSRRWKGLAADVETAPARLDFQSCCTALARGGAEAQVEVAAIRAVA
jgi:hypothetical protein